MNDTERVQMARLDTLSRLGVITADAADGGLAVAISTVLRAYDVPVSDALILGGVKAVHAFIAAKHPDKIQAPGVDVVGLPVVRE